MLELEAKRVKRSRIPAEVRLVVFQAVKENPFLYARELADHVHHLTGMMFSDEAIGRVRRDLAFKRRRAGIPLRSSSGCTRTCGTTRTSRTSRSFSSTR